MKNKTKSTKDDFTIFLEKQLSDKEFKVYYDEFKESRVIAREVIRQRIKQKITQEELSKKTGILASNISRLESGKYNPSIRFLQKVAKGLGKELHISFR